MRRRPLSVYSAMRGPAVTTRTPVACVGALAALPLAQRQVGDLVALGGQALGEVAIPALAAADGVREQAVVDDADAHVPRETVRPCDRIALRRRATFRPSARYNGTTRPSSRATQGRGHS